MAAQNVGKNVQIEVKGNQIVITIDITKRLGQSASGKTTTVATTSGNIAIEGAGGVILGLNAYVKP